VLYDLTSVYFEGKGPHASAQAGGWENSGSRAAADLHAVLERRPEIRRLGIAVPCKSMREASGFNHFLVEPLLRDGLLHLERCLELRRNYDELAVRWFEAKIQLEELFALNAVAGDEETHLHPLAAEIARTEADSESVASGAASAALAEVDSARQYITTNRELLPISVVGIRSDSCPAALKQDSGH
jgi:hypothetical protein